MGTRKRTGPEQQAGPGERRSGARGATPAPRSAAPSAPRHVTLVPPPPSAPASSAPVPAPRTVPAAVARHAAIAGPAVAGASAARPPAAGKISRAPVLAALGHPAPAGSGAAHAATPATPAGPATDSGRRHFGELRAALDAGWEIVQPIFARPLWSAADDSATAFNFVLHSSHGTRLITVPQGRLVERFIRARHLSVDYAR